MATTTFAPTASGHGIDASSPLGVYVGLNAGEPIVEDDDLFGTSINLAARICDHAEVTDS